MLEGKKTKIEEFVINGTFTKEVYLKKSNEIDAEIISKKIQLSDYENQIIDIDALIKYGKNILLNLSSFWLKLDTPRKISFQKMLFPDGIYLENNEFRTTEMSSVLKAIEDKDYAQSIMAGERGFEP